MFILQVGKVWILANVCLTQILVCQHNTQSTQTFSQTKMCPLTGRLPKNGAKRKEKYYSSTNEEI